MIINCKRCVSLFIFIFITAVSVYPKPQFPKTLSPDDLLSHSDDYSKLLTGNGYFHNGAQRNIFLTGLTHIMCLTVDSMHDRNGRPMPDVYTAVDFLNKNRKHLKIDKLNDADVKEFLTPAGNTHGVYTHLGWEHIYPDDDNFQERWMIKTNTRWLIRKKLLCDFLGKNFNFFLNKKKQDSFAALLYYVHILGDHENNKANTAYTRIPIKSFDEQKNDPDWRGWYEYDQRWKPQTTIIAELNKHIPILFKGQENSPFYKNLLNGINDDFMPENQKEKAKRILQILFDNTPHLLKNEKFAEKYYINVSVF